MLSVRLPEDIERRLVEIARKTGRTKTYYVREALLMHLEEIEDIHLAEERLSKPAQLATIGVVICAALSPKSEPEYMNYTEDMLYGAKWRWSWVGGRISNLWCFCPICDAQLVYAEGFGETNFICERCPSGEPDHLYPSHGRVVATVRGGDRYYAVSAAEREVFRRIRTGEKVSSND